MEKIDLKKQLRHLYVPSAKEVSLVDVPEMKFVVIDGQIEPGAMPGTSPGFAKAITALYGFSYTLKFMSKLRAENPIDYAVMALEGLWTTPAGGEDYLDNEGWLWTLMIMQPEHINAEMFAATLAQLKEKKENEARKAIRRGEMPVAAIELDAAEAVATLERVRLETFHEGPSIQIMHIGPYADEPRTLAKMSAFIDQNGFAFHGRHHEIYLGDPRSAKPETLKTVLRHPVRRAG